MKKLLCVVDYQNDFVSPDGKVAKQLGNDKLLKAQALLPKIQQLLDAWHKRSDPVLFLQSDYSLKNYKASFQEGRKNSAYSNAAIVGTWGHALFGLQPAASDARLVKLYFDGFYQSALEDTLVKQEITDVYFCGINTDVCVFHTAIGAIVRGYRSYVIEDATETVSSAEQKAIFLQYLKNYVGVQIVPLRDVLL
ncbi:MAG: isochorismatase family cysteine hydrolase [Patescibacteria group bacterium]|jgi:nicotinamidase-related amidase